MASIQIYLHELEARLAPALDAQALQERLTEAENHLRDRALEFEEVGMPPREAEARAVAAFGEVEEYIEDVPVHAVRPASTLRAASKPRDLALQLAWSIVALGAIAMITDEHSAVIAGLAAVAIFALGALVGRPTAIWRMGLLALVSAVAAFLVLRGFYEPKPFNAYHVERIGMRLRGTRSDADYDYRELTQAWKRFQRARDAHDHAFENAAKNIMDGRSYRGAYTGPSAAILDDDTSWRGENGYVYVLGMNVLRDYDTEREADDAWTHDGDRVQSRLREAVAKAKPVDPGLSPVGLTVRCALVAFTGGVSFLAATAGVQAIALALRRLLAALLGGLRHRSEPPSRVYAEPERS